MNNAKKIIKNQGLGTENPAKSKEVAVSNKNKILLAIGIIIILILSLGICYIQLRPREILQVTGFDKTGATVTNKIYYKEAMYDIYMAETQYNSYESVYRQIYGKTYWEAENVDSDGRDGASAAKKQVMDAIKQREILYMEAMKADLSLTDAENKTVNEQVESTLKNMSDSQKRIAGLDEKTIKSVVEKQALAEKYKQQVIAGLGIDEEALKKTVSKKDYRQYTLQYYTFAKTEKDNDGKDVSKDAATLKKAKDDMSALQKKAASAKDFTKDIITDKDSDSKDDNTGISYSTKDLIETDTDFLDDATRKKVKAMKNGTISEVIETKDAYYVIKMVNNNDSEAYDSQCSQVISDEKEKQFDTKYTNEIKGNYTTEVQSYWKGRVNLGYLTSGTGN